MPATIYNPFPHLLQPIFISKLSGMDNKEVRLLFVATWDHSADFATGGQARKTSRSWGAISLFIRTSLSFHSPFLSQLAQSQITAPLNPIENTCPHLA